MHVDAYALFFPITVHVWLVLSHSSCSIFCHVMKLRCVLFRYYTYEIKNNYSHQYERTLCIHDVESIIALSYC